ncbi:Hypothetical protein CulFRC58_0286 [Corynebacterium ulcerans FRC58]|uniref:Uncharacterized protein n=1 Tax=Corynebacterium ulcerans FRC58 TaxID=1408268 RepID=A0ABM5TZ09_CORUL|nr:Hypothetical protein CulFRC58_0286 [Corynebacterium ulcerans FRC58]
MEPILDSCEEVSNFLIGFGFFIVGTGSSDDVADLAEELALGNPDFTDPLKQLVEVRIYSIIL